MEDFLQLGQNLRATNGFGRLQILNNGLLLIYLLGQILLTHLG